MWKSIVVVIVCVIQNSYGHSPEFCDNIAKHEMSTSCVNQILGQELTNNASCKLQIIPGDSLECQKMFSDSFEVNQMGSITLKPFLYVQGKNNKHLQVFNYTFVNITFTNIKWKKMKFRFQSNTKDFNHCRSIEIASNVTINDQSVLYYDCYKYITDGLDGLSHALNFEAIGDNVISRGRYVFYTPTDKMLSDSINKANWKPFIYIEMLTDSMTLHIAPPSMNLRINKYIIQVVQQCTNGSQCEEVVQEVDMDFSNESEITYNYVFTRSKVKHHFVVIPIHDGCKSDRSKCESIRSPEVDIALPETLSICIASLTALIVAILFAYYVVLRLMRKYWCKEMYYPANPSEFPAPTKVLVVYSPVNRLHAKCVESFVNYLRFEYGFDVMYDGDIAFTSHRDPQKWAIEAFESASHMIYVVGPANESNIYNNIYDGPVNAYRNLDSLLLSYLKHSRASKRPKEVINILFEHSKKQLPDETKYDNTFELLHDWPKLIENLSKYIRQQKLIMRTDKGRCFVEDLKSAKKLLVDSGLQNV